MVSPTAHLLALCFCLLVTPARAAETAISELYIGFEKNRAPYAYLDEQQEPQGILIDSINDLCAKLSAKCQFVADNFDTLIENLQIYQLNAVLVIDNFVSPPLDHLKLSGPLCSFQPAFVQKGSDKPRNKPEDFQGITIGIRDGSIMHLRLLEDYGSMAQIRPYPLLEAGILDLASGRINVLFGEAAFFQDRVTKTSLGDSNNPDYLRAFPLENLELPATSMTLAIRENDTTGFSDINKLLKNRPLPTCTELLGKQKNQPSHAPQAAKKHEGHQP